MSSSQPMPQPIEPIIVEHTGPVDDEYYPVYNPVVTVHGCNAYNTLNSNGSNKMEIDDNEYVRLLVTDEVKLSSQEEANCTIIYNPSNELQIGDEIQVSIGWRNEIKTGNIINTTKYGSFTVRTKSMNHNEQILTVSKYNNIIRTKPKHESKMFTIIGNKERDVFTKYLETILPKQPTTILQQISSFLFDKSLYRRSVYFDCKSFEKLVKLKYNCDTNDKPFNISDNNNHWLGYDACYESEIYQLSKRGHLTFPSGQQRHEMYAQKPYLPKILNKDRIHLNIIQQRLNIALKTDVNLYKYQFHTVLWCYTIEQSVHNKQQLAIGSNHLRFTASDKCNVYNINNTFIPSTINRIIPQTFLTYKGGFICDDVGLGKTLTMLSLIASQTSHTNESITNCNQPMNTSATLLIAPSHLIEQWENEIHKHFKNMNKIIIITTAKQYKNVSYSDILSAQIVLVSLQFIGGTHYKFRIMGTREIEKHKQYLNPLLPQKPIDYVEPISNTNRSRSRSRGKQIEIKYKDLDKTEPFLHLIHWNRIILDEAHDILMDDQSRNVIFNINSKFKWYVSATPFPNNKSIAYAAQFLGIQFCDESNYINWSENINEPIGNVLHCIIYYHLFSRHTKRSILDDNYLPNIQQQIEYVKFHPIERLFYNIIQSRSGKKVTRQNDQLKREICSGVLTYFQRNSDIEILNENDNYLQNLLNINVKYYKSEINQLHYDLQCTTNSLNQSKMYAKELIKIKNQFANDPRNYGITFTLTGYFSIHHNPTDYQRIQYHKYVGINQKVQRLENEVKRIEKLMELELSQLDKENEMVTCDKINEDIESFERKFECKLDGKILLEFVKKYGSKQAVLIEFIKKLHNENINNRIIVFSVFNETLKQIKNRLSKINVNAVSCTGNVHSRKIAMKSFQNNDIINDNTCNNSGRIILLSSKNAASGANFNEATHVILCDQISGSSSESYAAEKQAIGRAVRQGMSHRNATKVIRFVVKDTIEQEIFERNEKIRINNNNNGCDEWKVKRSDSEIEFYMKINQMNELKGKDSKKRKRKNNMNERYDDKENTNVSNIGEPQQKRRRINQ